MLYHKLHWGHTEGPKFLLGAAPCPSPSLWTATVLNSYNSAADYPSIACPIFGADFGLWFKNPAADCRCFSPAGCLSKHINCLTLWQPNFFRKFDLYYFWGKEEDKTQTHIHILYINQIRKKCWVYCSHISANITLPVHIFLSQICCLSVQYYYLFCCSKTQQLLLIWLMHFFLWVIAVFCTCHIIFLSHILC